MKTSIVSILSLMVCLFAQASQLPELTPPNNYKITGGNLEISTASDKPRAYNYVYLKDKISLPDPREDKMQSFSFTLAAFEGGSMRISMSPQEGEVWVLHNAIIILVEQVTDGVKVSLYLKSTTNPGFGKHFYAGTFRPDYPLTVTLDFDREHYAIRFNATPGNTSGSAGGKWSLSQVWEAPLFAGLRIFNRFNDQPGKSSATFSAISASIVEPAN